MSSGQREAWDSLYRSNGRMWRGNCRLPDPLDGSGDALDVGCGSGKSADALIGLGYRVTGVDFSPEAVDVCRGRFGDTAKFLVGSVLSLPFDDGSFDYACSVHVLEHIPDADMPTAVSEIRRILRPGGYLFVRDFAPGDLRSSSREGSEIDYFHRTPEDLLPFFQGFVTIQSELAEERTRFGAVRRRTELLLRRLRRKPTLPSPPFPPSMKQSLGPKTIAYPMPVLIIGTYDEDGTPNAMNAAWGGICNENRISICIDRSHRTASNLRNRKAFTVGFADVSNVKGCDYVGIVSGNDVPDKVSRAGFHTVKSDAVDAPLFEELKLTLECRMASYDEAAEELLIGEIVDVKADDSILTDGKIDPSKLRPITFDPVNRDYLEIGRPVAKAFSAGRELRRWATLISGSRMRRA